MTMTQKKKVFKLRTKKKMRLEIRPNPSLEVRKEELDTYMKAVLGNTPMPQGSRK